MRNRRNPPIGNVARRGQEINQTGQESGQQQPEDGGDDAVIKVDPNQLANDITTAAIGAVAGSIATRMIFNDG